MKARVARAKAFAAASSTLLADALNAWFADPSPATGAAEKEIVSVQYQFDGANHNALVLFTE